MSVSQSLENKVVSNVDRPSLDSPDPTLENHPEKELVVHLEQLVHDEIDGQIEKSLKVDNNHYFDENIHSEECEEDLEEQTFYFVPRQVQQQPQYYYFYNFKDLTIFEEDEDTVENEVDEQQNYGHDEEIENRPESPPSSYESAFESDFDEENYEDALEML